MDNNISFGARFLQKLPVLKYSYEKKLYQPSTADIVDLNPFDINDVKSVEEIAKEFGSDTFVNNIAFNIKHAYVYKDSRSDLSDDMRILALTRQTSNFNDLKADEVLGVVEISELNNKKIEIEYLNTNPQYIYSYGPPYIKRIGTAIINYLKDKYDCITLNSASSATVFYLKNGFKRMRENTNRFLWQKPTH